MLLTLGGGLSSCSDSYLEEVNTDDSKAETIDPNAQLTTALLQTYGDFSLMDTYRSYITGFTQYYAGGWNVSNYAGAVYPKDSEMAYPWNRYYQISIKNLVDAIYHTQDMPNTNAALRIHRAYMMAVLSDIYGDIPCTEAGMSYIDGNATPKYDTQEDIYNDFFTELKDAASALDAANDRITGDVIYNGDVAKWIKLANSLRLRYAMRISDVAPEKARKEFEDALTSEGGVLTSGSDDALIKYMDISFSFGQDSYTDYRGNALSQLLFGNDPANNPSYLCSTFFNQLYNTKDPRTFMIARFYYDGLMSQTSPDNRIDLTDEITGKGIAMNPCQPGAFSYDPWPQGYDSDMMKEIAKTNPSVETTMARETEPKLANNFLRGDNPGVVMTCAEVNLLLAEASLKKWNTGGTVEGFYSKGVRAAMDFLADNYGYDRISDNDFNAYIADNGTGHTEQQAKAAINTQAWILHFTNPAECWANVRRSGYPRLKSPADYGFGQYLTGGKDIPVRLCYPTLESSYNKPGYDEALKRMGGKDSWNTHVWWDVE